MDDPATVARNRRNLTIFAAIAVGAIAVAIGLNLLVPADDSAPDGAGGASTPSGVVTYYVEGSSTHADVTMQTPTGVQQVDADVPLTRSSDGSSGLEFHFRSGQPVYVSAQLPDESGTITCRIKVDGRVVSENTSSGGYAIASCSGLS